jgi:Cysteine rich repeat
MKIFVALTAPLVFFALAAQAQTAPQAPAANPAAPAQQTAPAIPRVRDVCAPEVIRFCPRVVPGQGRLATCLSRRKNQLSPTCRQRVFNPPRQT